MPTEWLIIGFTMWLLLISSLGGGTIILGQAPLRARILLGVKNVMEILALSEAVNQ